MCKCMMAGKNAYYNWQNRGKVQVENVAKNKLKERTGQLFQANHCIYGSYRIQKLLEREDIFYSRAYIGLRMKEMGLRSVLKKKFVAATGSRLNYPIVDNILDRAFSSLNIGEKWVSDITYVRVNEQWNYLTTILDLADRKKQDCLLAKTLPWTIPFTRLGYRTGTQEKLRGGLFFTQTDGYNTLVTK